MQNNLNEIIANALEVDITNLNKEKIKEVISKVKLALINNKEAITFANEIDLKNNNGFKFNLEVVENIFNNTLNEDIYYGDVILSQKDDEKKIIYGKEIMNKGLVGLITEGNSYVIIEMILKNIISGNTLIINTNGYMYATNNLIIEIIHTVLETFNISKNLITLYISENSDELLSNYANINLILCIGDHNLQRYVLNRSKTPIIVSGYENFDIYIEDDTNLDFISKILGTGLNINVYINTSTKLDYNNAILVDSLEEAIAQINYNGNGYSTAIFTNSSDNASKFIKEVHSSIVTVNTSPTIERICDIKVKDLTTCKTTIYPLTFKIDNK